MVFGIGGRVAGGARRRFLESCKKWGQKGPKSVLPEGAVGMGIWRALAATPLRWADLYGPNDVRGYTGCPLGLPGLDFRAENAKFVASILEHFCGFCVSLQVHLEW